MRYIKVNGFEHELLTINDVSSSTANKINDILTDDTIADDVKFKRIIGYLSPTVDPNKLHDIGRIPLHELLELEEGSVPDELCGYKLINLNTISFGRFIDLDILVRNQTMTNRVAILVAYLYFPDEDGDYDIDEMMRCIGDEKFKNVNAVIKTFVDFRQSIYEKYAGLFSSDENTDEDLEEEETVEVTKEDSEYDTGLLELSYSMTNDNVLNIPKIQNMTLVTILNFRTFQKKIADASSKKTN